MGQVERQLPASLHRTAWGNPSQSADHQVKDQQPGRLDDHSRLSHQDGRFRRVAAKISNAAKLPNPAAVAVMPMRVVGAGPWPAAIAVECSQILVIDRHRRYKLPGTETDRGVVS